MGTVRFCLAMLVVYFHVRAAEHFGISLPDGRLAVQLFYVISGFYMALILNEKYVAPSLNSTFYSNRFFRLWPPMLAVMALVIVQFWVTGEVLLFGLTNTTDQFLTYVRALDASALTYLFLTNVFVLGQDWIWFLRFDPSTGVTWCPFTICPSHNGASFLVNHPTFTIAIEATYYLVSPLILRRSLRWPLILCVLGLVYHVVAHVAGWNPVVWSYHFVGSAAFFYFLGACAYHGYVRFSGLQPAAPLRIVMIRIEPWGYLVALGAALLVYKQGGAFDSLIIASLLALCIPLLFHRTRNVPLDRKVGELSYGIYLVHYPLYLLLLENFGPVRGAVLTLLGVVPTALLLYLVVEAPIDRWRQRRVRSKFPAGSVRSA